LVRNPAKRGHSAFRIWTRLFGSIVMHVRPGSVPFGVSLQLLLPVQSSSSLSSCHQDPSDRRRIVRTRRRSAIHRVSPEKRACGSDDWETYNTASVRRWRKQWPTAMIVTAICLVVRQDSGPPAYNLSSLWRYVRRRTREAKPMVGRSRRSMQEETSLLLVCCQEGCL